MHATELVNYSLGPIKIFLSALERPICRRIASDIAQIANLVGKLDQFGSAANCRCMLNLTTLAFSLRQRFVVS
jgi:hypothetical protein